MLKVARYVILNWYCYGSSTYFIYRKHAKVSGEGATQPSNISNAEIEAAKQEWAGLVLSDEE